MKNALKLAMALCAVLALPGCGYHLGFLGHPQIESIAVAPAVNETAIYNVAADIRMMMCESITQDGTYKLTNQGYADCVLFLVVKDATFADISSDTYDSKNTYKPKEWSANVSVEYKLIVPGQGTILREGSVTGVSHFQAPMDVETSRLRAVRQACFDAAEKVTWALAEGW